MSRRRASSGERRAGGAPNGRPSRRAQDRPGRTTRRVWLAAAVVAVAAILVLTLRPGEVPASVNLKPLEHHGRALRALFSGARNRPLLLRYLTTDVLGNLVLFLPFGLCIAGAAGAVRPVLRLALVGGLSLFLSAAVELIQLGVPGRASDVDDVIFNVVGALVGAAIYAVAARRRGLG